MNRRFRAGAVVAAVTSILVAGCGTDTVESANTAPVTSTESAPTDLDTADYRTWPQAEYATVRDEQQGYVIEAQRLAEYVVLPSNIDPSLVNGAALGVLQSPDATDLILPPEAVPVLSNAGMLSGFATGRTSDTPVGAEGEANALRISVLRFPDSGAAIAAADGVHQVMLTEAPPAESGGAARAAATETAIDVLPETAASISPDAEGPGVRVDTFTARGDFLIYVSGYSGTGDEQWIAPTVARTVDEQGRLLDEFPETPMGQFTTLPIDVDNVLILTLPAEQRSVNQLSVYGTRGLKHFTEGGDIDDVIDETGTDRIAIDDSMVFRSADESGAEKLYQAMNDSDLADGVYEESAPAPGVPGSMCMTKESATKTSLRCRVHVGRYTAMVETTDDELGVHQKTAAQYLILSAVA
ncbi:hypothetical protein O4220_21955 [Rhodococcus ruber]|uniref:Lipoprotein n=1 Tax=Rhodococcus ruber TaxID=1830 RepID=A0ABT4MJL9_9NOCA|nr:hypothetical protein [Rhodococcus ruber]MCZ4521186.1 hypothetical protein [Rhodococcus ruber]